MLVVSNRSPHDCSVSFFAKAISNPGDTVPHHHSLVQTSLWRPLKFYSAWLVFFGLFIPVPLTPPL